MTRIKLSAILLVTSLILTGCITYRLDIPQGNVVTQDQVDKLRVGLTKAQVQYLLGTSLIQDPFHNDRWEYIYSDAVGGKVREEKKFTVFFENGQLVRWEGTVLPLSERARLRMENEAAAAASLPQENTGR